MNRQVLLLLCVPVLCAWVSCAKNELPSEHEVEQLFVTEQHQQRLEVPQPVGVPKLDAKELGGWRILCDQCHIGPHYNSHTILSWGHKDECLAQTTCLNCHGSQLHRLDPRGSKQVCVECHMDKGLTTRCDDCHVSGWRQLHTPPDHSIKTHGASALEDASYCASCHGTKRWCVDCHGIQMPHPDTILQDHPAMVRGEPQTCANCHGAKPCESCHTERGVTFDKR